MPDSTDSAVTPAGPVARTGRWWGFALFVAGISVIGLNMRAAITSLPPVFPDLSSLLHLSPTAIAVLASAPVLCFGVFSPVAAPLARRFGEERVLAVALGLLAAGLFARGAAARWLLFPGTVLAAAAIAFMNVLLPSLVKRRRPAQAGLLIGIYLLWLSAGAITGSLIAVPVFQSSSDPVAVTLGLWALPALAGVVVWLPQWRHRTLPPGLGGPRRQPRRAVSRHLLAWQVMGFMGLQSLTYYTALSWLPTLFQDRGASAVHAGDLLALMNLGNAATALAMPVLAHRSRDQRWLIAGTVAASAAGFAGCWFAPLGTAVAWVFLLGLGQGAALGLAIYLTMARASDPAGAASLSGFAQSIGYLVATAGPLAIGFLHAATGSWTLPVTVLLAVFAGEFTAGWYAGRDRMLPGAGGGPAPPGVVEGAP